jgi:hypothetical protein
MRFGHVTCKQHGWRWARIEYLRSTPPAQMSARDPQSSLENIAADSLSVVEDKVPDTSSHNLIAIQTPPSHAHHASHTTIPQACVNYPNNLPANLPHQSLLHLPQPKIAPSSFPCSRHVIGFTIPASTASTPCSSLSGTANHWLSADFETNHWVSHGVSRRVVPWQARGV